MLPVGNRDRDSHAKIVGVASLADLYGKQLVVGSRDSPQARILPLHFVRRAGVDRACASSRPPESRAVERTRAATTQRRASIASQKTR